MLKIVEFITLSEIGGAQIVVYNIINSLKHKYKFYLITSGDGYLIKKFEDDPKVTIIKMKNLKRNVSLINDIQALYNLNKIIKKINPDILHSHSSKAGLFSKLLKLSSNKFELIFTLHGFADKIYKNHFLNLVVNFLEKTTSRFVDVFVFVSKNDKMLTFQKKWTINKSKVIYNGIGSIEWSENANIEKIINERKSQKKIIGVTIARLSQQKNPIKFIRFLIRNKTKLDDFYFVWIGSGNLYKNCQELIDKNNLHDIIHLTGKLIDAKKYIKRFDFFYLLSLWECLPISLIEALQSELPIVSTDVGGVDEMIKEKINGVLVDKDYSDEELVKALQFIYKTDKFKLGKLSGKIYREKFSLEKMVTKYDNLFKECN